MAASVYLALTEGELVGQVRLPYPESHDSEVLGG